MIEPHETAFVVDGQIVCREAHDELRPTCPYCGQALESKPASYSPCPHCRKTILVRTNQDLFDTTLLTREQSDEFDRIEATIRILKPFEIRARDYVAFKRSLGEKMELEREPTDEEIVWQLFHEAARRIPATDKARLADLFELQARFVHAQGKDHWPLQQKAARFRLQAMQAAGVAHVRLQGLPDVCLPSRRLHGQVLPISEAMTQLPLPCGDCTRRIVANTTSFRGETRQTLGRGVTRQLLNDRPFCDCTYQPASSDGASTAGSSTDDAAGSDGDLSDPGAQLLAGL